MLSRFLFPLISCLAVLAILSALRGSPGALGAALAGTVLLVVGVARQAWSRPPPIFLRGRPRLRPLRTRWWSGPSLKRRPGEAGGELGGQAERDTRGDTVVWGGQSLPATSATTHFLAIGTTGSGKTLLLNQLMGSVLPTIGGRPREGARLDRRALVYDAKGDLWATLHHLAPCRIETLHPFDARGAAWDIARDITTPASALQCASLLIPPERGGASNPFFDLAAQNVVRGVLLSLMQSVGTQWDFRDVVLATRFEERLRQLLEKSGEGRAIWDQFFGGGDTWQGVRATLATKMAPFEIIAAAWNSASHKVSLAEFLAGEFVLVLGNDDATRTALDAINRVLFQRLSELILAGEDTRARQTWLFLDEVREAGRLEGLSRLMTKGRSKGACLALGIQSIEGMREVYGPHVAEEIAGLCNNKAVLRLESASSAQWGSALFGQTEEIERRSSRSRSLSERSGGLTFGQSRTSAEHRVTSEAVMASEIMTLPPTGPAHGLHGFCLTRAQGAYRAHIPWNEIQLYQPPRESAVRNMMPRPHSAQYLREWTPADLQRLQLKPMRLIPDETRVSGSGSGPGQGTPKKWPKPVRLRPSAQGE